MPKLPHFCYTIAVTTYNRLFEEAIDNYGLVTTSMARKMGIEPGVLVDLAYRGRLTRIGQGVYQLVQYAPGENDPYAQAVALVNALAGGSAVHSATATHEPAQKTSVDGAAAGPETKED